MAVPTNRVPRLDRPHVIRTALGLLDDVGLDGLTLRRLAAELDVKAPALYWHFTNKQELLDHVADAMTRAWMQNVAATYGRQQWDDSLAEVGRSYRALLLSHRDGARLVAGSRPVAEALPLLDGCIAAFRQSTGCSPGQSLQCLTTVTAFVRGFVLDEQAEQLRRREEQDAHAHQPAGPTLTPTAQAAPCVDAAIDEIGSPNGANTFEFGLHLIIEGIRAALSK